MRLPVNEAKSGVRKPDEVAFLGFSFRCNRKEDGDIHVAVFPAAKAVRRLKATIRDRTPPNWGRSITTCMEGLSQYLNGWIAYFRLFTPEAVDGLRVIDSHIRRRIRAIIVRHRKRPRFLFRHLVSKGASLRAAASCAFCGKRAWAKSNRPAVSDPDSHQGGQRAADLGAETQREDRLQARGRRGCA